MWGISSVLHSFTRHVLLCLCIARPWTVQVWPDGLLGASVFERAPRLFHRLYQRCRLSVGSGKGGFIQTLNDFCRLEHPQKQQRQQQQQLKAISFLVETNPPSNPEIISDSLYHHFVTSKTWRTPVLKWFLPLPQSNLSLMNLKRLLARGPYN